MEERIGELEDRVVEFIQSEEQKEKRMKKSEDSVRELSNTIKWTIIYILAVPEKEERKGQKTYLKK